MIKEVRKNTLLVVGICFAMLTFIPFFLLGEDSVITYHDQMDGEVLTYILNAKYLFSGVSNYPELMNGIPRGGLVSPAPGFILLYKFLQPFHAFLVSALLIKIVAFASMFLLVDYLLKDRMLGFFTGILFMLLPFYPVYGFSIPGQPLLWYAMLRLKNAEKKQWINYFIVVFYGICSSFALGGFACLVVMMLYSLISIYDKDANKLRLRVAVGSMLLLLTYLVTNLDLVRQFLPGSNNMQYISHRSEAVIGAIPFTESVKQVLLYGANYAQGEQKYFLPIILAAALVGSFGLMKRQRNADVCQWVIRLLTILFFLAVISILYGIYCSSWIVSFRNESLGILHDFNLDRVTWLMPVLWYLALAYSIKIILLLLNWFSSRVKVLRMVVGGVIFCAYLVTAWYSFYKSDLKPNVVKILRKGNYYMMTWKQFYAEDLFRQVDELIGRPKEEYCVVSLGIYPAAAAYNGFYCLDAYSNNYDIEYKHEFRKVIEGELDKSEYLAGWFDQWGNRCYIVLAETNNYFTFEKRWGTVSRDVDLNWEQLRTMGCEYIISASYIIDAESMGLQLLNDEPIESEDSWYRLFVYQL